MHTFQDDEKVRWTDRNPVTYEEWYNPKRKMLYPDRPGETADNQIPEILRDIIPSGLAQPVEDPTNKCTIMFPYVSNGWGNWAKFPCHYKIRSARFLCKTSQRHNGNVSEDDGDTRHASAANAIRVNRMCPKTWTYFNGTCLKLISPPIDIRIPLNFQDLSIFCGMENGTVAFLDKINFSAYADLIKYKWKHVYQYGSIVGRQTKSLCTEFSFSLDNDVTLSTPFDCSLTYGKNVLCETTPLPQNITGCKGNLFQCSDGMCISKARVCDGVADCGNSEDEQNCTCGENMYACADKSCISLSLFCDFRVDCADGSDESLCVYPKCNENQFHCKNGQCVNRLNRCDRVTHCLDGSDEQHCDHAPTCRGYRCYSGKCLPSERYWDNQADCDGLFGEDESGIKKLDIERGQVTVQAKVNGVGIPVFETKYNYMPYCQRTDETKCDFWHPHCFQRHFACIYDDIVYGEQACRRYEHLRNCSDFSCPGYFKCPESYCIPHRKVCDGVWDCLDGFEEKNCKNRSCTGLFKCVKDDICISTEEICDGKVNCPASHDDERLCGLACPSMCHCEGYFVGCSGTNITEIPIIPRQSRGISLAFNDIVNISLEFKVMFFLHSLNISHNKVDSVDHYAFKDLNNLFILDLSHNGITNFYSNMFKFLHNLRYIYVNGNPLVSIEAYAFHGLSNVLSLDISNSLQTKLLVDYTFTGLGKLQLLNITDNIIDKISYKALSGLSECESIDLRGTDLELVDKGALANLSIDNLYTDKVKYCCMAPLVEHCLPKPDEFSSCDDLMSNTFLRICIWILGTFATVGNVFVFFWRILKENVTPASLLIVNLAISDFLMGIYMLIIGSFDMLYRGEYIVYAEQWKSSFSCAVAGFLSTTSSEMSVFLLLVITFDRVKVLLFPFSNFRFTKGFSFFTVLTGWVICIILAIIPILATDVFGDHFYGQNSVCLPFTLRHTKNRGWVFSLVVFVVANFAAFIAIFIGYVCIYRSVILSRKSAGNVSSDDLRLARRITLIVLTDFLCWVPIILLSIVATSGVPIPGSVSAWVAVIILPLNSAINPILYTLSSVDCRSKKKGGGIKSNSTVKSKV